MVASIYGIFFPTKLIGLSILKYLSRGFESLRIAEIIDICDMSRYNLKSYVYVDHEVFNKLLNF